MVSMSPVEAWFWGLVMLSGLAVWAVALGSALWIGVKRLAPRTVRWLSTSAQYLGLVEEPEERSTCGQCGTVVTWPCLAPEGWSAEWTCPLCGAVNRERMATA